MSLKWQVTVWGGQRGFEPLPNGREFSLATPDQMPNGPLGFSIEFKHMVALTNKTQTMLFFLRIFNLTRNLMYLT